MKQTTLIAIILGVLVLISVVQAFQLNGLKNSVSEGQLSISSSGTSTRVATSSGSGDTGGRAAALPTSIKNLPTMVGGC